MSKGKVPEKLPGPQDGALHVAATPECGVVVYGPDLILRFDLKQVDEFIALLQRASLQARAQRYRLEHLEDADGNPFVG